MKIALSFARDQYSFIAANGSFEKFDNELFSTFSSIKLQTAMQVLMKPELIEKELISSLSFKQEVKIKQHPDLSRQIEDATRLGNAFRSKVSIIFQDDTGLKRVDTTIWAAGTMFICLKGGVWIPIERILEVRY